MNLSREKAWEILTEYTKSESLLKHALAVEAGMRYYAKLKNQNEELWGITGLLHDFDYEKFPSTDEHPYKGVSILKEKGYPEEMLTAIMGHAEYTNTPRTTDLAKTLFAVDELAGFIMAVAYLRPDKLEGMAPKSVKKKLKTKGFAAGVSREDVEKGIVEMEMEKDEHIQNVINALTEIASELGLE